MTVATNVWRCKPGCDCAVCEWAKPCLVEPPMKERTMHITEVTQPYTVHVEVTADEWAAIKLNQKCGAIDRDLRMHNVNPVYGAKNGTATLCVNIDARDREHALTTALDVVEAEASHRAAHV